MQCAAVIEGGQTPFTKPEVAVSDIIEDIGRQGVILMSLLIKVNGEMVGVLVPGRLGLLIESLGGQVICGSCLPFAPRPSRLNLRYSDSTPQRCWQTD